MNRALRRLGIATALLITLAVVASSSQPVRLWVVSSPDDAPTVEPTKPHDGTEQPDAASANDDDGDWPSWVNTVLQLMVVPLVLLGAMAVGTLRGPNLHRRRRRLGAPSDFDGAALPRPLEVDIGAARAALLGELPNDAIIACWMQLERDASRAGVPRWSHETAAEFATRVIAEASVDAAPIAALASLYREARFSRHRLDDDARAQALDALHLVEHALRHRTSVAL